MADTKLTKSVGEHWVCSMLARHGWAAALTRDGLERTDILAVGTAFEDRPLVEIQVKTATGASEKTRWALNSKAQQPARSQREWFVLVAVPPVPAAPRGFVVPRDHLAAATWIVHQDWRTDPTAQPGTRNATLDQARIRLEVWAGYENRWDLLAEPTDKVPVLLPDWVRDRALEDRVGLPPAHPWADRLPIWGPEGMSAHSGGAERGE